MCWEATVVGIVTKIGMLVDVRDIVPLAEFELQNLEGGDFTRGISLTFSIDFVDFACVL